MPCPKPDLPQALIDAMEAGQVKTADGLRSHVYRQVAALGFDLSALIAQAREAAVADAVARLKAARSRGPYWQQHLDRIKARAPVFPTAPTPERRRQDGDEMVDVITIPGAGPIPALKAHRSKWVVDHLGGNLTAAEMAAAEWARWAWWAHHGHARTGDYGTGSGGVSPGSRVPITPEMQEAAHAWRYIRSNLAKALLPVVTNFVCQVPPVGSDRPLGLQEFGRTFLTDGHNYKVIGAAEGVLRVALAELAGAHVGYPSWRRSQGNGVRLVSSRDGGDDRHGHRGRPALAARE